MNTSIGNKEVFAKNLNRYMVERGKTRREVCQALGFSYSTFTDWCNGNKYPRIDKIEMLANYFGIEKSDLIEEYDYTAAGIDSERIEKLAKFLSKHRGHRVLFDYMMKVDDLDVPMVIEMIREVSNK